jgi:hypothetical protein
MPVYFITCDNSGPVKIGHAKDMEKRVRMLQIGNPKELRVRAAAPGGQKEKAAYHRQFAKWRQRGEWFTRSPEIIAEMRRLRETYRDIFGFL